MRGYLRSLAAALAGAAMVFVACSSPEDPGIPPPPGDDAGAGDAFVGSCAGAADGTPCGPSQVCLAGVCTDTACGDGVVTPPEECDNGTANAPNTGCEPGCKFTCVAGDANRACPSADPCVAVACDAQKHTCGAGTPLPNGAACGTGKACVGGQCLPTVCGNGLVEPGEDCDNGDANGPGKGCESNCKFSCANAATDCAPVACNTLSCSATHLCQTAPDTGKNGTTCGATAGYTCSNGACVAPGAMCGNGVKEGGEDCDFGSANNGPNKGCESNCKFSCTAMPLTCIDMNACNAAPTCDALTVNGQTGYKCNTGAPKADGTTCGAGAICLSDKCAPSVCGDGYRDPAKSETCDDGNTLNLDACDSSCHFEQDQRVVAMTLLFTSPVPLCATTGATTPANAMADALKGSSARSTFQGDVNSSIQDGSLSALFKFVSADNTGQMGMVTVGSLAGTPAMGAGYNGTSDVDWWYSPDPLTYDATRTATALLTGSYTAGVMDATGRLNLTMNIGGSLTLLKVSSAHIKGPVGAASVPKTSAGATPGHIAGERLNPALTSYETSGGGVMQNDLMCGNILAASLDNTAPPTSLISGLLKCSEKYTTSNRMLDIFVNGCTVFGQTEIAKTQPDAVDPSATPAGMGGPYTFQVDGTTKRVNQCKDKTGAVVNLTTCLNAAAYSSSFKYATDRVIIK